MVRKWALLGLVAVVGAVMAGCTDPIVPGQDAFVQYPQVQVDSYWLQTWTRVQPPVATRMGAGQLQVDIPIRNLTDSDLNLDFKYYFTDKNGVPVENPDSWVHTRVPRKGIGTIEFQSLSAMAQDFHVEIRVAK